MLAKIRGKVSSDIPDETVAAAMLAAKRNGIRDAESIGSVGVANDRLWVGAYTPGFHTGVSVAEPIPPMQDTLRETQSFDRQRDQQLAQEAAQRGQADPNRGPKMQSDQHLAQPRYNTAAHDHESMTRREAMLFWFHPRRAPLPTTGVRRPLSRDQRRPSHSLVIPLRILCFSSAIST